MGIEKEVLVYQSLPRNKYRWVAYICYMQAAFLVLNFWTMPSGKLIRERDRLLVENRKKQKLELEGSENQAISERASTIPGFVAEEKVGFFDMLKGFKFSELLSPQNLIQNVEEKPAQASAFALASMSVVGLLWLYTSRLAHKIILLPNDRARFIPFSPLPFTKPAIIETNLKNIACISPRESEHNFSILKFRNHLGYHLVNKKEGEFLKPELYDEYLGFQRSWYKK